MKRIITVLTLCCLGVLTIVLGAGTAQATAPPSPPTFTYRASLDPYHVHSNDFKISQKDREDVVMRQIVIAPGADNGWHFHPGPVFTIVVAGTLSLYEANDPTCTATRYSAGQGFVEIPGDVHIARNESPDGYVVAEVTFLDVPVGGVFRIPVPRPGNCPF